MTSQELQARASQSLQGAETIHPKHAPLSLPPWLRASGSPHTPPAHPSSTMNVPPAPQAHAEAGTPVSSPKPRPPQYKPGAPPGFEAPAPQPSRPQQPLWTPTSFSIFTTASRAAEPMQPPKHFVPFAQAPLAQPKPTPVVPPGFGPALQARAGASVHKPYTPPGFGPPLGPTPVPEPLAGRKPRTPPGFDAPQASPELRQPRLVLGEAYGGPRMILGQAFGTPPREKQVRSNTAER